MNRLAVALPILASLIQLSCGDPGPAAGEVVLNFESPSFDDWAIRFTVTASAPQTLEDITATCAGCQAFMRKLSDTELRVIIYGGPLPTSELARISVSDAKALSAYSVTLLEVAGGDLSIHSPATRGLSLSLSR
ncbi:MAG: hypothetical protein JSW71_01630 [Gemmatimonadota bacterium]|nr:MAG: hypothetical protein JSW71_01630 [Gemmatimonadota bacterium]